MTGQQHVRRLDCVAAEMSGGVKPNGSDLHPGYVDLAGNLHPPAAADTPLLPWESCRSISSVESCAPVDCHDCLARRLEAWHPDEPTEQQAVAGILAGDPPTDHGPGLGPSHCNRA